MPLIFIETAALQLLLCGCFPFPALHASFAAVWKSVHLAYGRLDIWASGRVDTRMYEHLDVWLIVRLYSESNTSVSSLLVT
jgi:hypothetical protein